jgi:hypothetical protein
VLATTPGAPVTHTICQSCADWTLTHQTLEFGGAIQSGVDYFDLPPRDIVKVAKH